jgi:hypothetical protein
MCTLLGAFRNCINVGSTVAVRSRPSTTVTTIVSQVVKDYRNRGGTKLVGSGKASPLRLFIQPLGAVTKIH